MSPSSFTILIAQGAAPDAAGAAADAAVGTGPTVAIIVAAVVLLVALAGGAALLLRQRRVPGTDRKELPVSTGRPAVEKAPGEKPTAERPVDVTEGMSLREIKAAKSTRLSESYLRSDESQAEKERRKGKSEPVSEVAPTTGSRLEEAPDLAVGEETSEERREPERPGPEPEAVAEARDEHVDATPGTPEPAPEQPATTSEPAPPPPEPLTAGLEKTRAGFVARIGRLFAGRKKLDDALIEELEEVLFTADIGVQTSQRLLDAVQSRLGSEEFDDASRVWDVLRAETAAILGVNQKALDPAHGPRPFVVLMVGVNGAGKTTTIGKLAAQYERRGLRVLMVAGDTFRAAAVDQLEEWSRRVGCGFHRGEDGADPSSVIYDGLVRGASEEFDVILCDTAGRLQTKKPLMDELEKIARVADKAIGGAPHETVLVLDANTGQNAIQQAQLFREAAPLTGLILTKLDGTAKGGVVIGISQEMKLPIYHIGIGESVSDLRAFDPAEFVDALY